MIQYLVLKNLDISNASAYNNFYCVGTPSLTGFAGVVDKVRRIVENCINAKILLPRFSIIIHDHSFVEGMERHVRYMSNEGGTKLSPLSNASSKEEYKCNLKCSIIIAFDIEDDTSEDLDDLDSEEILISDHMNEIQDELHSIRICGGRINNEEDFLNCFSDNENMLKFMNTLPAGYFISDYSAEFREYMELFDNDALKTMIYLFTLFDKEEQIIEDDEEKKGKKRDKKQTKNPIKKEKAVSGWIAPTNMGFVRIHNTHLDERCELRDDYTPAYFVEALTGVIEYKFSKRLVRKLKPESLLAKMEDEGVIFKHKFSKNVYKIVNSKMENN